MKATFKLDSRKFNSAVRQLAGLTKNPKIKQVMRSAAGQVIRRVVSVTPPSKGEANKESQVRGEKAIAGDLLKIAVPTVSEGLSKKHRHEIFASLAELAAVYKASRVRSDGRVNPRSRKQKLFVNQLDYNRFLKELYKHVGALAAGWNTAAKELGVRLPAWITRHGTRFGEIRVTASSTGFRIFLANKVDFVDNVHGLRRQLQWALDTATASIIEKQIPAAIKSIAKKAGFKVH